MDTVRETREYDKFKFLTPNREQSRGHVEVLKNAFQEIGNLTKVQPILVNDKFEIIDGQHRFTAAKELGQPIFYTQHPGLGIREARSMNILHRNWTVDDYAQSYAMSGDKNYQAYLRLKEDYGFSHSIMLPYISGFTDKAGVFKGFRNGDFVLENEEKVVDRLEMLTEAIDKAPLMHTRGLALAFLRVMQSDEYNHATMLKRLEKYGHKLFRVDDIESNLRQLEELYNHNTSLSNRVRLY